MYSLAKKKTSATEVKQVTSEVKTVKMEVEEKHVIEEEKKIVIETKHEEKEKKKKKKKRKDRHERNEDDPEGRSKRSEGGKENHGKKQTVNRSESFTVDKKRIHVKSVDPSKVARQFNKSSAKDEVTKYCKACGKQVFQMEQIKAEKEVWHKTCFRCKECQKQLTIDIYQSHEGDIYCKPHFKQLFQIKAVVDEDQPKIPRHIRKPEMIIRESNPIELPDDVIRSSDKPDYGLEEISQVTDVKSRFEVFEKAAQKNGVPELTRSDSQPMVKRSSSILNRMSRFQNGSLEGVPDSALNGEPLEGATSSSEEDDVDGIIKNQRMKKESIPRMERMADVKSKWESGTEREERREELKQLRKEELLKLRQAMCSGQTNTIKTMYQEAVQSSNEITPSKCKIKLEGDMKASSLRERFERGESLDANEQKTLNEEDELIFSEAQTARGARNLFKELDATTPKGVPQVTMRKKVEREASRRWSSEIKQPIGPVDMENLVRASDQQDDVQVETKNIASKFKFFETYKEPEKKRKQFRITPPREGQSMESTNEEDEQQIDENGMIRSADDSQDIINVENTRSIRNKFLMMEEDAKREQVPLGPKPLKRFTPPPDYNNESDESEDESGSDYSDEDEYSDDDSQMRYRSIPDEEIFALKSERAASLRAKFEQWETQEMNHNQIDLLSDEVPSTDTARNLRAKFEAMKTDAEKPKEKPRGKVNRFISELGGGQESCCQCDKRVYPLEKLELEKRIFHKNCFRCSQCNTILRMDTYTMNNGVLFCIAHFKQTFLSKGKYEATPVKPPHRNKSSSSDTD